MDGVDRLNACACVSAPVARTRSFDNEIWRSGYSSRPELKVLAHARWSYWASTSPIPGGPACENFEIMEPFRQGEAFRFSVEPLDE